MPRSTTPDLNCIPVTRDNDVNVTLVPLPRQLWMPMHGKCHCETCQGRSGFFDTLAVPQCGDTYLIHEPILQPTHKTLGHSRRLYHLPESMHKSV